MLNEINTYVIGFATAVAALVAAYHLYAHYKDQAHRHKLDILKSKNEALKILVNHQKELYVAGLTDADKMKEMLETKLKKIQKRYTNGLNFINDLN